MIFGLLWVGAAAATPAGTVVGVSGSCTDLGRPLSRGDMVQIGDTLDSFHKADLLDLIDRGWLDPKATISPEV